MNLISWTLLMLTVVLGTLGQLSLKYTFNASKQRGCQKQITIKNIVSSKYFWIWFICYVIATVVWLIVLRSTPLSKAFPALGLTFACVPLSSHYFLKEKIILRQWLGIAVIIAGVCLVVQK